MIKCNLVKRDGTVIDITEIAGQFSISGASKECTRTLDMPFLRPNLDPYLPSIPVELGDTIELYEIDERTQTKTDIYSGVVWKRVLEDNSMEQQITAYDKAIYLNKSDPKEQVYTNKTAAAVAGSIIGELGLEVGELATGEVETYNGRNMKAYDLIMHAYTKASKKNKKKYMLVAKGNKINVFESGKKHPVVLEELNEPVPGKLLNTSYSEDLDDLVNKVEVVEEKKEDKKEVKKDKEKSQKDYGVVQKIIRGEPADIPGTLKGAKREVSVECIGDWDMVTGMSMELKSTIIQGEFFIISDKHEYKDGVHTVDLKLSTEFEMDEREEGQTEDKKAKDEEENFDGISAEGAAKVLAIGKTKIGKRYLWATAGPNTFDCSGFVSWCAIQAGFMPPKSRLTSSSMNSKYVHKVPWNSMQPGDILHFYGNPGHVGYYMGNGKVLECGGNSSSKLGYSGVAVTELSKSRFKNVFRFNKTGG